MGQDYLHDTPGTPSWCRTISVTLLSLDEKLPPINLVDKTFLSKMQQHMSCNKYNNFFPFIVVWFSSTFQNHLPLSTLSISMQANDGRSISDRWRSIAKSATPDSTSPITPCNCDLWYMLPLGNVTISTLTFNLETIKKQKR